MELLLGRAQLKVTGYVPLERTPALPNFPVSIDQWPSSTMMLCITKVSEQQDQDIMNWILWDHESNWTYHSYLVHFVYLGYLSQWWRASSQHCRGRMFISEVVRADEKVRWLFSTKEIRTRIVWFLGWPRSSEMCEKRVLCKNSRQWAREEMRTSSIKQIFYKCCCCSGEIVRRHFSIDRIEENLCGWLLSPCLWGIWQKARWGSCLGVK